MFMLLAGLEPMIPVFEQPKTELATDHAATFVTCPGLETWQSEITYHCKNFEIVLQEIEPSIYKSDVSWYSALCG
jgi:hypothetical protein